MTVARNVFDPIITASKLSLPSNPKLTAPLSGFVIAAFPSRWAYITLIFDQRESPIGTNLPII
jgi:hypothetical protein